MVEAQLVAPRVRAQADMVEASWHVWAVAWDYLDLAQALKPRRQEVSLLQLLKACPCLPGLQLMGPQPSQAA